MKRIIWALPILLLAVTGCQPDKYKTLEAPSSQLSALAGTWKLYKVTQTDEDAAKKGFPYTTVDLTTAFPYTDFRMTFNVNGTTPTTFTTTPGNSPKIIKLVSGNWTADDPAFPKVLTLASPTDTAKVTLGSYPTGSSPDLKISVQRFDAATGKLLISYSYAFVKQ